MLPLPLLLLLSATTSTAVRLPIQSRRGPHPLRRRADPVKVGAPLMNVQDVFYAVNVTLGGTSYPVTIDTGSADLWVIGNPNDVPNAKDTGKTASVQYAIGKVAGNVKTASMSFAGYDVQDQAFIDVQDPSTFSSDPRVNNVFGLIGLGPDQGSNVQGVLGAPAGGPPLDRIFELNKTSSNFVTFQLDRQDDPTKDFIGQMTVSEVIPERAAVQQQTKLAVAKVSDLKVPVLDITATQHWSALTDQNGIIGPDGSPLKTKSIVPGAEKGTLVAVFDSGFTLPQVSRDISDEIYGRVKGAEYDVKNGWWTVPCGQLLNLTFVFGGQKIPIHPLDVTLSDIGGTNVTDAAGKRVCVGAFQPLSTAFDLLGTYDLILGMAFLRNTYTLLDFGDFAANSSASRGDPFIQLLSVTDPNEAHADFVQSRLGGKDTTGDDQWALLPANQQQHSPVSDAERRLHLVGKVLARWPYVLAGVLGGLALLLIAVIWCCCRRRRRQRSKAASLQASNNTWVPGGPPGHSKGRYSVIDDPYAASHEMLPQAPYNAGPQQGYHGSYQSR